MRSRATTLTSNVAEFFTILRRDHGFKLGGGEIEDALRAVEAAGVADFPRFRAALRMVACGKHEELAIFKRAFDAFFLDQRDSPFAALEQQVPAENEAPQAILAQASEPSPDADDAPTWETLRVRYSAAASASEPPEIDLRALDALLPLVDGLIAQLRLGRSRRWKPNARGRRFDLRRTLRASLRTGGDPVVLRRLGHPRRNPRFALLIDGSRSMSGRTGPILSLAAALCRRTLRAKAFVFSTELREVTRALREARGELRLAGLETAWGGGTRIGASLLAYLRRFGGTLNDDTLAVIFSDGLDVGEIDKLEKGMREFGRRAAGVVWINPSLDTPGYSPETSGMRAALPHVGSLIGAKDPAHIIRTLARLGAHRR